MPRLFYLTDYKDKRYSMTLNDLNTMQKADKYTQDGRDQIIDAGFEEGHISHRADGDYIKQGGTWKPYTGGKSANGNNAEEKWQKNKNEFGRDRLTMKTRQGGQIHIYESENPKQKNARFRVDGGTHYNDFNTLEEAQAFAEKHWGPEEKPGEQFKYPKVLGMTATGAAKRANAAGMKSIGSAKSVDGKSIKNYFEGPDGSLLEMTVENGKVIRSATTSPGDGAKKMAEEIKKESKTPGASQKPAENKGMEEKKYQDRKQAQQVEAARQNKNYRDFYDNTGLTGRGGPEEALVRNEADKEDRKQDNLKAGKRDDSMFKQNDKIEFNRAGHYINGKIEKVDKDWQGNVSLYVRGDDGKGYWVETNNVTKHQTGDRAPLTGDTKIRVKK